MSEYLTLYKLNNIIKEIISDNVEYSYWIVAEISQLSSNYTGHAYLELVEKDTNSDKIIAKSRATIWASFYRMIKPYFESVTGYEIKAGIKVLINVSVEFHELYGFSLNVIDIDPVYTLGDIEKRKTEILRNLEESGVMLMNKEFEFPLVPQRIAIITSSTAAGYEDFLSQLKSNPYNYVFYTKLFPAIMQGNQAELSIINALEKIFEFENEFDLVVIIRGGGSKTDLSCFDSENLAFNICQFPIPVITGIGHDRDVSIADMVAHTTLKTPTAVAEFLISKLNDFEEILNNQKEMISELVEMKIDAEKRFLEKTISDLKFFLSRKFSYSNNELDLIENNFQNSIQNYLQNKKSELQSKTNAFSNSLKFTLSEKNEKIKFLDLKLKSSVEKFFIKKGHYLEIKENIIKYQHPRNILKRGYSITRFKGKALKFSDEIQKHDIVETELFEGKITSNVN